MNYFTEEFFPCIKMSGTPLQSNNNSKIFIHNTIFDRKYYFNFQVAIFFIHAIGRICQMLSSLRSIGLATAEHAYHANSRRTRDLIDRHNFDVIRISFFIHSFFFYSFLCSFFLIIKLQLGKDVFQRL